VSVADISFDPAEIEGAVANSCAEAVHAYLDVFDIVAAGFANLETERQGDR